MQHPIKLVAIDLDGTLLRSDLTLSPYSQETLKALVKQGVLVVLASGRPYRSMKPFYMAIESIGPLICYNGAHVFNPHDHSFRELKRTFKKNDLIEIYRSNEDILTSFMCESEEKVFLKSDDLYLNDFFPYRNISHIVGDVPSFLDSDCYTAIFNCEEKNMDRLRKGVEKHSDMLFRRWSGKTYSEAFLKDAHKGHALQHILKECGISSYECLSFGDSDNDFEMLMNSKYAFAMKDSKSQRLKNSFPLTKEGHDDDGVAKELVRIFNLEIKDRA